MRDEGKKTADTSWALGRGLVAFLTVGEMAVLRRMEFLLQDTCNLRIFSPAGKYLVLISICGENQNLKVLNVL